MLLNKEFDHDIIIYAFRYTLGRHSYAPGLMRAKLDELWDQLSEGDRELIIRETEEYVRVEREIHPGEHAFKFDVDGWANWVERKRCEHYGISE